ncbi:hypothetical protein MJO52_11035 [Microbulbifer variabilis]|uniref:Uncharacterized protein n=1 Tax=Microbulbifer variabilis TaxID=266805 RepID=A0ABY4V610_9GAMM|nr:hypothetical protein [Microbulbifer variabilis]USD19617.1 hypothetical protein MJO52_11035 [Microbulbifer variabilis]
MQQTCRECSADTLLQYKYGKAKSGIGYAHNEYDCIYQILAASDLLFAQEML